MQPIYKTYFGLLFLLMCCFSGLHGQSEFGAETIANTTTTSNQTRPAVAQAENGDFIVAWESEDQDGDDYGVYCQVFDSAGNVLVSEKHINTSTTAGAQRSPSVAITKDGQFTVAWMSDGEDGDGQGVYRRMYDASGTAVTSQSRVNSSITGDQKHPDIAMDNSGNYCIVFEDETQDGDGFGILLRPTQSNGTNLASSYVINDSTTGHQINPAIGMDTAGNFVVVWQSDNGDGDGECIKAKLFDSSRNVVVSEWQVNTTTAGNQQEPDVYMFGDGSFVVIWSSYAQDGDQYGIYAQRYNASGVAQGSETLINATTANSQDHATVVGTYSGNYAVLWGSYGQDGSYDGVYLQSYRSDGTVFGDEARVNSTTTNFQQFPAAFWRMDSLELVVAWQSGFYNSTSTQDGDGYGVVVNSAVMADTVPPTAVCQNITVHLDGSGNVTVAPADVDGGSSDNVGITSFTLNQSSFTCANLGSQVIILTVGDSAGNTASCNAGITITDSVSPTAVCQDVTIFLDGSGAASITAADLDNGSTDNCSVSSFSASTTSFGCAQAGTNTVTLTVTDGSGNTGTCTSTVTVQDSSGPAAVCQDLTVYLDGSGAATITGADTDNGSSDNCSSNLSYSLSTSSFACADTGSNSVTLTVTDPGGNTATCTSNVTVIDSMRPTAVCTDISAYLDGSGNATITAADVGGSSSDNCGINTQSINVSSFTCSDLGTNSVTLTLTDVSANSTTCTASVVVVDSLAPTMVCQNITVYVDGSGNATITAGDIDNGSSDNCSLSSTSANTTSFTCANVGSNSVVLTGTDGSSNSATCTATVTVLDTVSPTAVCQNLTVYVDGSGNATITTGDVDNGSTDNCSISSYSLSQTTFTCSDLGANSETLTVTDVGGGTATCNTTITILDTVSPTAVCNPFTVYLDGAGTATVGVGDVGSASSDNCASGSASLSHTSFTCADTGSTTFTLTATDGSGNTDNCSDQITVIDSTAPTMSCSDVTIYLDGAGSASITTGDIDNSSSDNCGLSGLTASNTSFTCANTGNNTVTLTGTDVSSNSSSCVANVTVLDSISPTAVCQGLTVTLDASGNASITTGDVDAGSSDNCGVDNLTLSQSAFTCADVGSNSITLTVADASSNTTSCTTTAIVQDTTSPVAVCSDVTLSLDGSGNLTLAPGTVDNGSSDACTITNSVLSNTSFTCADTGTTSVTLTVTDANGNNSSCTANVTIQDSDAPVMVCQDITVQLDGTGNASITTANIDGGTSDNCGISSITAGTTAFTCSDVGANTVVLTGVDVSSNTATCNAIVTVEDNIAPTASCNNLTVILDVNGNGAISTTDADAGSTDNCSIGNYALSTSSFTCADVGSNSVTLTVTDVNSNSSTCISSVVVMDTTSPAAVCQDVTLSLDGSGNATLSSSALDNGSSDACTIISSVVSTSSFTCVDTGTTTVTLTLTDPNSNTSTCTGNVTIQDVTPPTMVCRDITVQLDPSGNTTITTTDVDNGTSDNCGVNNLSINTSAFTCSDVGSNTVTLTGTDVSSNSDNCTSNVTVEDNIAPTSICQNVTIYLDGSGNASITTGDLDNGSNDACGINAQVLSKSNFTCSDLGGNTVLLTNTDVNSNSSNCASNVQVRDSIAPNPVCQNVTIYLDGSGAASTTAADVGGTSTDNCTITGSSLSNTSFLCFDVGPNNVTFTLNDQSGNTSSCGAVVTVEDTTSPAIVCSNTTVQLDPAGNATITASNVDGGTTDNCGILASNVSTTAFTCADVGNNPVTLTVDDINGNTSNCIATVTVQDNVAPVALCQGVTVHLDLNGNASITTGDVDTGSNDACGIANLSLTTQNFNCSDVGSNPVIMTATDVNGNSSNCNLFVQVIDSTAPTAVCQNLTLYLDGNGNASTTSANVGGASSDNCGIVSNVLSNGSFTCVDVGVNPVTITVDDPSGNSSVCNATITVEDSTSPAVICNNLTVQLSAAGTATLTTAAIDGGTTDNCGISSLQLSQSNITCADLGVNSITLLATDVNSNTNSCQSTVTVLDQLSPVASCQNLTIFLDGSGNASITPADVDAGSTDNCSIDNSTLSTSNFTCNDLGVNVVGLTVSDPSLNSNTCVTNITVNDTTPPAAVCANITATLGASGSVTITSSDIDNGSTDNCTITNLALSTSTFTCSDIGSNSVTLTATDQSSNDGTCTANVFVQDTSPPVVVCVPLTVTLDAFGADTITTADIDGGSTDNCSISSLTLSTSNFGCTDVGVVVVTMTAVDPFGNTTSCTSNVTVQDTVPPAAICVSNITLNLDASGAASLTLTDINNGSSDNCAIQTAFIDQSSFTCVDAGNQVVTLFITDANGNADSCSTNVFVQDNMFPTAVCQNLVTFLDTGGLVVLSPLAIDNGSNDNCGISNLQINIDTLDCGDIGVTQIMLIATDPSGNADTCNSSISVQDTSAPIADCQNITAYLDVTGNLTVTGTDVAPGSSDNCGITYSLFGNSFDCADIGNNQVFVTVTDPNGLTNSCASTVTLADSTRPDVTCQDITVTLPASNTVSIAIGDVTTATPTDNCGVLPGSLDISSFNCSDAGVNTVTVTVPDVNGNIATCTSQVTVVDALPPTAQCQSITVSLDAQGVAVADPADADGGSTDNCGVDSLALSQDTFACADVGLTTQTLYVYDLFGNVDSCDLEITVEDNIAPVAVCSPDTVGVDTGQVVFITGSDIDGGSSDNCGIASLVADPDSFTIADLGFNSVVLTVTDPSGNTSTCNTTVFVEQMVGVEDAVTLDASVQFDAYPNPTQGMLTIDVNCIDCIFREGARLTLVDMRGKVLDTHLLERNRSTHSLQIDMSKYALGNYLLRLETERGKAVQQIIKY